MEEKGLKKIAIFTSSVFAQGGESRVVTVIANELSKKYDITIYSCEKDIQKESIYGLGENIKVFHYFPYGKNPMKRLLRYFYRKTLSDLFGKYPFLFEWAYYSNAAARKMRKTVENQYDAVIAVSGNLTILLGKVRELSHQRSSRHTICRISKKMIAIGWEHNSYEAYFETPNKYLWKREEIFKKAVNHLDECFVLNEDIAEKYKKHLGLNCKVMYNPRSFASKQKSNLRNKQFIACGNFVEAKGFDLLIDSFYKYASLEADWNLVVVGDGVLRANLEKKIEQYQLSDRIFLTGYVDDIKPYLFHSSVFLLSSRWEGFPMCVTEAFEMGLPVICYDIPAMIPLMKKKEGIQVKQYDTDAFAKAMYQLATQFELRKELSQNAIQMADTISIEKIGQQWFHVLEDLMADISL